MVLTYIKVILETIFVCVMDGILHPYYQLVPVELSIEHELNCLFGGFPSIRHNGIRDFTPRLMREVFGNVVTEPILQTLSGETLLPRSAISSDIKTDGFWGCGRQSAFFDVRIFNSTAHSCWNRPLTACYRRHELEKRRLYEDRVLQVEHGSFTPSVFSTAGGMGPSGTVVYKRLAALLAIKRDEHYSKILSWICCKISFALNHSAIMCLQESSSRSTSIL